MYDLIIFLALLALGYGFGRYAEHKHYVSILDREEKYRDLLIIQTKFPPITNPAPKSLPVHGSVVVSVDYFKRFIATLRTLVGGRVTSYESLLDRGRREAILRMKEMASARGSKMIVNVKLETASISKGAKNTIGSIEVYAYGTALVPIKQ